MVDYIGRQLGNYRIIRSIGRGGFADVYLGEHIYLKTQVAIKLLQMQLSNEDVEGFLKEARTIAHLVHPHIVRVMDFGIEGETPFLVMDYASNGTIRQRYPNGGRELCFEGTGLINLADYGFDKQTMSINIAANGVFFNQSNGQGTQLGFYYGDEKSDLGSWDNQISSFRVTS